jgi:hypothetical protein
MGAIQRLLSLTEVVREVVASDIFHPHERDFSIFKRCIVLRSGKATTNIA